MSVRPGCFSFVQLSRMASASALIALLAVLAASIVTTGCGARVRPCPITTPVCGFDGYEYSSYCEAYEQGVLVAYPGECSAAPDECKAQCSGDWDPVCWTNSKPAPLTFGSACYAKCTGKKPGSLEKGSCRPSAFCKCTKEYRPVCGVDGKTYGNACAARCAEVPVWYADKCPDLECLKVCKALAEPVCANNGVTYPGACHALCLGYSNYTPGACTREPANCGCIKTPSSSLSAPTRVCGVDGVTYGSACEAACKEADVAYPGPCKTGRHNACSACPQLEGRLCALPSPSNRLKNPTDFYNPCYAACNKHLQVTSLWPYYYAQPCNAACDAKCKGTVTSKPRSSAVCCEDGFEYPSRCYAECLNGNNDGGDGASFDVGRCVPGRCGGAVSGGFGGRCSANGATAKCALPDPCEVMGCAARPDALCVFNGCERWYRAVLITGLCQPYFLDPVSGDLLVSGSGSSTKRCGGLCTKEGQVCRLDGKGRPCCPKLTCWGGPVVRDGQVNGTCLSDPLPRG